MLGSQGPVVRLVNRVVAEDGTHVPQEIMVGGEAAWVRDTLDLPMAVARIAIQQTMFRLDPVTSTADYRLGCEALGVPETPIPVAQTRRAELIDRRLLPPDRQFGAKDRRGRTLQPAPFYNPITPRRDAPTAGPRPHEDGASPGEFVAL